MSTKQLAPLIAAPTQQARPPWEGQVLLAFLALVVVPGLLAYGFAVTKETLVVAGVIGLLAVLLVVSRPYIGLTVFVALLYMRPEESFPALTGMRLAFLVSVLTLIATWFYLFLQRSPVVRTPVNTMVLGFGAIACFSAMGSADPVTAVTEIAKLVILVLLIINLVRTPERYQLFSTAIILFTLYLASHSLYLYFTGGALLRNREYLQAQATGIFNDPNDLSASLVAGLAITLGRIRGTIRWSRFLYLALALVITVAIFHTNSRGGLVAFIAVVGAFTIFSMRRKAIGLGFAAVMAILLVMFAPGRMASFDTEDTSANSRFHFWDNGINALIQNPVTGIGYDRFPEISWGYTAHNSFVLCFTELGIPGYFCWMGIIYFCFRKRRPDDPGLVSDGPDHELFGARLALFGFLTGGFFLSRTYNPVLFLLFTLPIARQIAVSGVPDLFPLKGSELFKTYGFIFALCLGSIVFISVMAGYLM